MKGILIATAMVEVDFCALVEARVKEQYNLLDTDDLCYNLFTLGMICEGNGVDEAARIVAMHLQQV